MPYSRGFCSERQRGLPKNTAMNDEQRKKVKSRLKQAIFYYEIFFYVKLLTNKFVSNKFVSSGTWARSVERTLLIDLGFPCPPFKNGVFKGIESLFFSGNVAFVYQVVEEGIDV